MSEFYKPLDGKKQLQEMMNDTPTPETDHLESNLGYAAHPVLLYLCRKLESERDKARKELTAVTEQRDRLAAYRDEFEEVAEIAIDILAGNHPVIDWRDAGQSELLRNLCQHLEENASLSALDEARGQRDRLAEALQNIKNELGVPQPEYPAPIANAVKIADDAIQSLNKDHFPDVGNMIGTTRTEP